MKLTAIAFALCVAGVCVAAPHFKLSFPEKKFAPDATSKSMISKAIITDENFIAGPDGKFAFVLTDKNAEAKKVPTYSAVANFPFASGSAEVTFKVLKRKAGNQVRILHVFSPAQDDPAALLIYYIYINTAGNAQIGIQVGKKQIAVTVPAKNMTADAFNTVKMTWNDKVFTASLNGKKVGEVPMTPDFAKFTAKKRGWSTLFITPVFNAGNEDWSNRAAVSYIDIK